MGIDKSTRGKRETPLHHLVGPLSKTKLLTAADEASLASEIRMLRTKLWCDSVSYLPFVNIVADIIQERSTTPVDLATIRASSLALRRRDLRRNKDAHQKASQELASKMVISADLDGRCFDFVYAELDKIFSGRDETRATGFRWVKDSAPYTSYRYELHRSYMELTSARDRFLAANLRLVVSVANRYNRDVIPLQDLVQEGTIGLMKAVMRFDASFGYRFSTYATWWIRHAIGRSIVNTGRIVRLPVHIAEDCSKIRRIRAEFFTANGRYPTDGELVELSGFTLRLIKRLSLLSTEVLSLDEPIEWGSFTGGDTTFADQLEDNSTLDVGKELDAAQVLTQLDVALSHLSELERDIINNRFALDSETEVTLRELGERHNLSRERIRQVQNVALGKLRNEFIRRRIANPCSE